MEPEDGDTREIDTAAEGRTGKYHLDYFGIAGCAYCLLFGQYIEVTTARDRYRAPTVTVISTILLFV